MTKFTEHGFSNRDQGHGSNYSQAMTWVVDTAGSTITMQLNAESHFARKHLLLPTLDAAKAKQDKESYGWGIWWLLGWETGVDTHVKRKSIDRVDHRKRRDFNAPQQSQQLRWAQKYRSPTNKNTVLNLVTTSQKSIQPKTAAVAFAKELIAAGVNVVGGTASIEVDFGCECVITADINQNVTYGSKLKVLVELTAVNTYKFIHLQ